MGRDKQGGEGFGQVPSIHDRAESGGIKHMGLRAQHGTYRTRASQLSPDAVDFLLKAFHFCQFQPSFC